MEKNIEQAFFNEFLDGGAAWRCLEYMKLKYGYSNLDEYPEELKKVYITDAPSIIKELTDAYDSKPLIVSIDGQPPLMWTEIEKNLEDCKDDGQKNRYLYSLLLPFKEWSEVFFPKHFVECFRQEIEQCEHDIPYHEKRVANLKDRWDKDEALGDIEACRESINESDERIKWLEGRHDYYLNIFRNAPKGSVEWYCYMWYRALYIHYANPLDALLLKFNIDLLTLQDQFGIWLKYDRNIIRIYGYIGTLEWTQKLIDNLPTQQDAVPDNHRIANVPAAQTAHFSVDKSYEEMRRVLTALQQQGFISAGTTIETFYYRMTGMGVPTNGKVEWIKKGKKRKSDISKSSLVYFLKIFANYNVDQTSDCNNKIQEIFSMSLPSSTITRSSTCEYKAEIDNIVEVK